MKQVIIDVREKDEFSIEHMEGSINIPLSVFTAMAPGILNQLSDRKITFSCHSGARAKQAQQFAEGMGFNDEHDYEIFEGGLVRYKQEGGNTVALLQHKVPLSLMRQVQIIIGVLVMAFALLGVLISPAFSYATLAMGGGILIAGVTGFCALATVVGKLPWNQGDASARKAMCQMS